MDRAKLYIVVPCFNEEEVIDNSINKLLDKLQRLISSDVVNENSKIMFVNDGSTDRTSKMIATYCESDRHIGLINFSRNYGHQYAILAGMMVSKDYADIVITIDADLQQDIEAIDDFVMKYYEGNDVVYGVRNDRSTDGLLKKGTAQIFYKLMSFLGCDVKNNSADYRLMSKKALDALGDFEESNLFLRGLIPTMGFKSDVVYFDVKEREAGKSKYTFKKMVTLAVDGITSLSIKPIRFLLGLGMLMCIFSIFMILFSLVEWAKGNNITGYSTTVISIWMVGGCILLGQGIVGEYIGKMYFETKKRPRYIIESMILPEESNKE